MKSNKKVLLFGGSYNPIHHGHINAALIVSKSIKVDEVWLMPRRFDYDGSLLLNSKHRLNMINLAIKHFPKFKICDVEIKDVERKLVYTYNTISLLTTKYPDVDFYFLIGADQVNNFRSWLEPYKLSSMVQFVCYRRPGYEIDESIVKEFNFKVVDGPQVDMSSTEIRAGKLNKMNEDIQDYINKHHLYLENRIKYMLDEKRYNHVLSTAKLAQKYARANHVDPDKAYLAGLLHDIAKRYDKETNIKLMKQFFSKDLDVGVYSYHAYVSAHIVKNELYIKDKAILNAIMYHSSANKHMSKLSKIIYVADKLEESRAFADRVKDIRELGFKDLDLCFIKTMEGQVASFSEMDMPYDKKINEVINHYRRKYNGR